MVLLAPSDRRGVNPADAEDPVQQLRRMRRWHEQTDELHLPPLSPPVRVGGGGGGWRGGTGKGGGGGGAGAGEYEYEYEYEYEPRRPRRRPVALLAGVALLALVGAGSAVAALSSGGPGIRYPAAVQQQAPSEPPQSAEPSPSAPLFQPVEPSMPAADGQDPNPADLPAGPHDQGAARPPDGRPPAQDSSRPLRPGSSGQERAKPGPAHQRGGPVGPAGPPAPPGR